MPILPGKTIGILGGGQLGRMFAIAARRMGYYVHAFDPTRYGPTGQIADVEVNAAYDDLTAARRFAQGVDIVTFEFENVPSETLAEIEKIVPVHPSPHVLDTCRHRLHEKEFLSQNGFPVAPFRKVASANELRLAIAELGTPCILKTAEFGYDGKGQTTIHSPDQADEAWGNLKAPLGVLEGFIQFEREISVIGARGQDGVFYYYPPFENAHRNHILDVTTSPAQISDRVDDRAAEIAIGIAQKIDLIGLICVEMFVVNDDVIVNELAPRPHNSGHLTVDACVTSQFEQQLRAICGLPMGNPSIIVEAAAMANLLGDIWSNGEPKWANALANP
ncbi:MAG TPA: 5-(carboxyamino)imidazole ribonucleotide synthase, partial [Tepidisphaeraceae bacterium]|nr:5-(carboxyamino)imidazole ribonucleotide synthase [Tepidisphaeraceae bacterium]